MSKGLNVTGNTVTAKDDAFIYHVLSGKNGVFNYGNKLSYQTVTANLIRIKDGMAQIQGRNYIIYPSETIDINIDSGTQGNKRYDLIVLEFTKSSSTETMLIKCIKGTPTTGNPIDPILTQQDTLVSGTIYQFPLYRVKLNGINIEGVDDLRTYIPSINDTIKAVGYVNGILTVEIPDNISYLSKSLNLNTIATLEEPYMDKEEIHDAEN